MTTAERIELPSRFRGKPLLECIGLIVDAASYGFDVTEDLAWLRQQGTLGEEAAAAIAPSPEKRRMSEKREATLDEAWAEVEDALKEVLLRVFDQASITSRLRVRHGPSCDVVHFDASGEPRPCPADIPDPAPDGIYTLWDIETNNVISDGTLQEVLRHAFGLGQANPNMDVGGLVVTPPMDMSVIADPS